MIAKLSPKIYITLLLLFALTAFGAWGTYYLNVNEILMEDGTPMGADVKLMMTIVLGSVVLSWGLSFLCLLFHALRGEAFHMDGDGIHATITFVSFLAFIFVVPVSCIPYEAITHTATENGVLTAYIDKSKVDAPRLLKLFLSKRYRFFAGYTKADTKEVEKALARYMRRDSIDE